MPSKKAPNLQKGPPVWGSFGGVYSVNAVAVHTDFWTLFPPLATAELACDHLFWPEKLEI